MSHFPGLAGLLLGAALIAADAPLSEPPIPLRLIFDDQQTGEAPEQASWMQPGEDLTVRIVDGSSEPADPFGGDGNKSLMLEDTSETLNAICAFKASTAVTQGTARLRFYATSTVNEPTTAVYGEVRLGHAGDARYVTTASVFLAMDKPPGKSGRMRYWVGDKAYPLDQTFETDRAYTLTLTVDLARKTWFGLLDGEPLTADSGARRAFPLFGDVAAIDTVSLHAAWSAPNQTRFFFDDLILINAE